MSSTVKTKNFIFFIINLIHYLITEFLLTQNNQQKTVNYIIFPSRISIPHSPNQPVSHLLSYDSHLHTSPNSSTHYTPQSRQ